jgi:hypothetical protein
MSMILFLLSQYFTNKQCEKVTCPIGQVQLEIDLSDHKIYWTRTIGQTLMLSPEACEKFSSLSKCFLPITACHSHTQKMSIWGCGNSPVVCNKEFVQNLVGSIHIYWTETQPDSIRHWMSLLVQKISGTVIDMCVSWEYNKLVYICLKRFACGELKMVKMASTPRLGPYNPYRICRETSEHDQQCLIKTPNIYIKSLFQRIRVWKQQMHY